MHNVTSFYPNKFLAETGAQYILFTSIKSNKQYIRNKRPSSG